MHGKVLALDDGGGIHGDHEPPRGDPIGFQCSGEVNPPSAKVLLKSKTLVQRKRCPTLWGPEEQDCVRMKKRLSP